MSTEEDSKYQNLISNIADYIHTEDFFVELTETIKAIKKEEVKVKLMFELMNFCIPKQKAIENAEVQAIESISIGFSHAEKPEEGIEDGT